MSDQVCLARAAKEFKINSSTLKSAIKCGLVGAKTKGRCCRILLSREEIQEKLPIIKTGSTFFRNLNHSEQKKPLNHEKTPLHCMVIPKPIIPRLERQENPVEPERKVLKIEGSPWTSSPCIGCKSNCDPANCDLLAKWAINAES